MQFVLSFFFSDSMRKSIKPFEVFFFFFFSSNLPNFQFLNGLKRLCYFLFKLRKTFYSILIVISEEWVCLVFSACGAVPSPFDCFLVNRGLKTMHLRMKEHMKNGLAVARFLEGNPRVEKVLHPGKILFNSNDLLSQSFKVNLSYLRRELHADKIMLELQKYEA